MEDSRVASVAACIRSDSDYVFGCGFFHPSVMVIEGENEHFGFPCQPVRNDIVTPIHLFYPS